MSQLPSPRWSFLRTGLWWRLLLLIGTVTGLVVAVWWFIHRYEVRQFAHPDEVLSVAFFSDGDRFVTSCRDHLLRMWETETGRELRRFRGCQDEITFVAISPDDRFVLAGSRDGTLRLWEPANETPVWSIPNEDRWSYPTAAVFLPNNPRHAVVAWGNQLVSYDVENGQRLLEFTPPAPNLVKSLSVSFQGRYVLLGPGPELQIRDTQTGAIVSERFPQQPDNEWRRLDLPSGLLDQSLCHVFSPDGHYFALGYHASLAPWSQTNDVVLWNARDWTEKRSFQGHSGKITSVAFTTDGRHIVSGSEDGSVRVWDRDSGVMLRFFWGHDLSDRHAVNSLAIHPKKRLVLAASRDKLVRLWELP